MRCSPRTTYLCEEFSEPKMKQARTRNSSLFWNAYNLPYDEMARVKLYRTCKDSLDLIQRLGLRKKLAVHSGCVNTISWNETGEHLLSGSDDQHLIITNAFTYKIVEDYKTTHKANIFSAKFLPCTSDTRIVSCSGDGMILFSDLMCKREPIYKPFNCHCGTTYELATIPMDPNSFLSCGEDGTVRWFDLRYQDHCNRYDCKQDVMIACQRAVTALAVNATAPYQLAIGCSDSTVRVYDRRALGTKSSGAMKQICMRYMNIPTICTFRVPSFKRLYRISSLCFSPDGEEVLVSYSSNDLYLFSVKDQRRMNLRYRSSPDWMCKSPTRVQDSSPTPVRRLRLRGDWSDTGPDARPERECGNGGDIAQARPTLQSPLMQQLTNFISRLLNDPATRAALNGGGEESLDGVDVSQQQASTPVLSAAGSSTAAVGVSIDASSTQESPSASISGNPMPEPDTSDSLLARQSIHTSEAVNSSPASSTAETIPTSPVLAFNPAARASAPQDPSHGTSEGDTNVTHGGCPACLMAGNDAERASSQIGTESLELISCAQGITQPVTIRNENNADQSSRNEFRTPYQSVAHSSTCEHLNLSIRQNEELGAEDIEIPAEPSSSNSVVFSSHEHAHNSNGYREDTHNSLGSGSSMAVRATASNERAPTVEESTSVGVPGVRTTDSNSRGSFDGIRTHQRNTPTLHSHVFDMEGGYIGSSYVSSRPGEDPRRGTFRLPGTSRAEVVEIQASSFDENSSLPQRPERTQPREPEPGPSQNSNASNSFCGRGPGFGDDYDSSEEELKEISSNAPPSPFRRGKMSSDEEDVEDPPAIKQTYTGHRNARTMIKEATFWGTDYVMSGSDCGRVFIWERYGGRLVMLLEADAHVVNCLQPHPYQPLLATSGIDHDVKLWAPVGEAPLFDQRRADEIVKRNALMLEETRDTITVPPSFLVRMVACLNQIRRVGRTRSRRRPQDLQDD